jgi:DNA-binding MarR family transcriptional regulator
MIEAALAGTELPPEDYPVYVLVGAEGPWTPTALARRMEMPLSTMLFRLRRLERRGHAERIPNPDDRRSYLIRLTKAGERLLGAARPAFRDYAEAVEGRLGSKRVEALRAALEQLRAAVAAELDARG